MNTNKKASFQDVKINVKIKLSALWIVLMFCYTYADILGFYAPGNIEELIAGEIAGMQTSQMIFLGMAILFVIPILMVFLSLTLPELINRWANIIVAIIFFAVNFIGLPGYPGAYDKFLIGVGLGFNVLTVWYAWRWPKIEV